MGETAGTIGRQLYTGGIKPRSSSGGVKPQETVAFVINDTESHAAHRNVTAGLIEHAVQDGARAIIFDIAYLTPRGAVDEKIKAALSEAEEKGIPVYMLVPFKKKPAVFTEGVTLGHNLTNNPTGENPPNPTSFYTKIIVGQKTYTALPWLVAKDFPACERPSRLPPAETNIKYPDLKEKEVATHPYNEHANVDLRGKFVFIGYSVEPQTGEPVDIMRTDQGERRPGLFDIISASVSYSKQLCDNVR